MPVAFDTLKAAKRLQDEAGFSEKQAGVLVSTLAEGVGENLATKADIEAESHALRSEMQARDERLLAELAAIRSEMREREQRLMVRVGGMIAGGLGIGLAALGIVTAIILAG